MESPVRSHLKMDMAVALLVVFLVTNKRSVWLALIVGQQLAGALIALTQLAKISIAV